MRIEQKKPEPKQPLIERVFIASMAFASIYAVSYGIGYGLAYLWVWVGL